MAKSLEQRLQALSDALTEDMGMNIQQAGNLLRRVGIDTRNLRDDAVRDAMRDKSPEVARQIAAAYRTFRAPQDTRQPGAPATKAWEPQKVQPAAPKTGVTLWAFNGEKFDYTIVVPETESRKQMVQTATKGAPDASAVFTSDGGRMALIYVDGRILNEPIVFDQSSANPNNDWNFVGELPRKLADITRRFEAQADSQDADYKAWFNAQTGAIKPFDAKKTYYDALRDDPKTFNIYGVSSMLKARIHAERNGWCAVGVNSGSGKVGAVVAAMTPEQALKAARMLFKTRWKDGDWESLTVKTNDSTNTFNGRTEIRDYLKASKSEVYL